MKPSIRSTVIFLFVPKSILLGIALFNFIMIWVEAHSMGNGESAGLVNPWYYPWSYTNEPTRLLVAAFLIWLSRSWSYMAACVLSGYIVAFGMYYSVVRGFTLFEYWRWLPESEFRRLTGWDAQFVLAAIVLGFAAFYLVHDTKRRDRVTAHGV